MKFLAPLRSGYFTVNKGLHTWSIRAGYFGLNRAGIPELGLF